MWQTIRVATLLLLAVAGHALDSDVRVQFLRRLVSARGSKHAVAATHRNIADKALRMQIRMSVQMRSVSRMRRGRMRQRMQNRMATRMGMMSKGGKGKGKGGSKPTTPAPFVGSSSKGKGMMSNSKQSKSSSKNQQPTTLEEAYKALEECFDDVGFDITEERACKRCVRPNVPSFACADIIAGTCAKVSTCTDCDDCLQDLVLVAALENEEAFGCDVFDCGL